MQPKLVEKLIHKLTLPSVPVDAMKSRSAKDALKKKEGRAAAAKEYGRDSANQLNTPAAIAQREKRVVKRLTEQLKGQAPSEAEVRIMTAKNH